MPDPVTVAATGAAIGGSLLSGISGLTGNRRAKKAARRQADLTFMQRRMEREQLQRTQSRIMGENRARVFASNLQMSGSPRDVVNDVQSEFLRDLNDRYNAALSERNAIRAGGRGNDAAVIGGTALNIGSALMGLG